MGGRAGASPAKTGRVFCAIRLYRKNETLAEPVAHEEIQIHLFGSATLAVLIDDHEEACQLMSEELPTEMTSGVLSAKMSACNLQCRMSLLVNGIEKDTTIFFRECATHGITVLESRDDIFEFLQFNEIGMMKLVRDVACQLRDGKQVDMPVFMLSR